jgi:hypothetical protein
MSIVEERRRHPSAVVKWPATVLSPQTQIEGQVENVSPVGAFISFREAPPLEWDLRLVIKPPNHPTMSTEAMPRGADQPMKAMVTLSRPAPARPRATGRIHQRKTQERIDENWRIPVRNRNG